LVEYTADRDGYKPRITYTEAAPGADGRGSAGGAEEGGYYQGAGQQQSADNQGGRQQNGYQNGRNQGATGRYSGSIGYSNGLELFLQ
ncbi:unnamed protein product, partial [Nesidiocoris tenuis]